MIPHLAKETRQQKSGRGVGQNLKKDGVCNIGLFIK